MKKLVAVAVAMCCLAVVVATATTYTITGDIVSFSYAGQNGGVNILVFSPNYTYNFGLSAVQFSGNFTGNATNLLHQTFFSQGGGVSFLAAGTTSMTTLFGGEEGFVEWSMGTIGDDGEITVHLNVYGENTEVVIYKPEAPEPVPQPYIRIRYIYSENGNIVGGRIINFGNEVFRGTISYKVSLAFMPGGSGGCNYTKFDERESPSIVIRPGEEVEFFFAPNVSGGYTFWWPGILFEGNPLSFTVFPPPPDSQAVEHFEWAYNAFYRHGNRDTMPDIDFVAVQIRVSSGGRFAPDNENATRGFWLPIIPYFEK